MKKLVILLSSICLILFTTNQVYAYNYINNFFKISLKENKIINTEESITLDLDLDVDYGLNSIMADLVYDIDKIELTQCESEYFTCTYKDKLLLDNVTEITGNKTVAKLTFKILTGFEPGNDVTVELKNVRGFNNTIGNNTKATIHKIQTDNTLKSLSIPNEKLIPDFSPEITNYKIITTNKYIDLEATSLSKIENTGRKELKYGNNIIEIVVTSETNTKKTYIINVFREKEKEPMEGNDENINQNLETNPNNTTSTNNKKTETSKNNNITSKLSSNKKVLFLKIPNTDFIFDENTFDYTITLSKNIKTLKIDYELEDKKSRVIISGDTNLSKKSNEIIISVIAEDGSQIDYKININKEVEEPVEIDINETDKKEEQENNTQKQKNTIYYYIIPILIFIIFIIKLIINKKMKDNNIKK